MDKSKDERYIDELVGCANLMELTRSVIVKVGLEYIPPMEPGRVDEIVSKAITRTSGVSNA